ncbi:signal peptide protein [Paenibacillus sp. PL2-23]|uniref:signal peptide protein n=1 Tax=Paenibacillus sp. PL2-23 TaxID=2100729 RepID=UPI0030FC2653
MLARLPKIYLTLALGLLLAFALAACSNGTQSVFETSTSSNPDVVRVPWDYRVIDGTVGDLIGSDMTILPDNTLMPNDNNYATGDKVFILQFMDAEMITHADQRNEVRLSAWQTLKTFKQESDAQADLEKLKVDLTAEVDLVGVYKTEFKGETRNFAIVELPTGNRIKQPIDEAMYNTMSEKQTVNIRMEEVHDFADYDSVYSKFRGWAN